MDSYTNVYVSSTSLVTGCSWLLCLIVTIVHVIHTNMYLYFTWFCWLERMGRKISLASSSRCSKALGPVSSRLITFFPTHEGKGQLWIRLNEQCPSFRRHGVRGSIYIEMCTFMHMYIFMICTYISLLQVMYNPWSISCGCSTCSWTLASCRAPELSLRNSRYLPFTI